MQRRVYELPADMVQRIVRFQAETGKASEVDAVRELLDEALAARESGADLEALAIGLLNNGHLRDVAKAISVRPQLTKIEWINGAARISCRDGHSFDLPGATP